MSFYTHEIEAPLTRHGVGKSRVIWYQVLFLPTRLARELPLRDYPRLRVRGEIADIPVAGAWMPSGDGRHYFIVSAAVRKGSGARIGDLLVMRFVIDDQDRVDVPLALEHALVARPQLQMAWRNLSPGKRRGLAYRIAQAKSDSTVKRRVEEVLNILSTIP